VFYELLSTPERREFSSAGKLGFLKAHIEEEKMTKQLPKKNTHPHTVRQRVDRGSRVRTFRAYLLKKCDPGSASRLGGSRTRKGENNKWDIKKNSDLAAMLYELVPAKAITFRLRTFAPWLENEVWQGCAP